MVTVQLQNRSPWHREPQYSLVVIIHIDASHVSNIEAVEACIRFVDDDDDDDDDDVRSAQLYISMSIEYVTFVYISFVYTER